MNKVISILVAVLLCIPCFNSIAADGGIGNVYLKRELSPSPGFQYKEYYATNNNGKQLSHTFTLVPGEQTSVSLGYADSLYGRQTATETVCYGESTGKNVVAAVNGNSFSLQSGVPNGTAISEGKLLTYENSSNSIGVKNDNTIVYGINDIKISIEHKGENLIASKVNKWAAQGSGLYIFSADYAKSTKTTGSRIEAVIRPNKAANLSTNAKITCTVISSKATYNSEIPKGCFVLSASTSSQEAEMLYAMKSGDTVTINCTATKWANVDFAIGTDKVIVSDGKYLNGAATKNDSELAARTAVGITQNGNLLFFLCNSDGKYGKGLTTEQTAKEMISLGVKYACFLSGGQYTTAALGQEVINFPSSGKEVPLGCTVMFTNTNKDPAPTTLKITSESPTVFTNGFVRLSISAADSMGNTKNDSLSNLKLSLSQPLGVVSGTLFKCHNYGNCHG